MTDIQDLNQLCPSLGRIFNDLAAVTDFVSPPPSTREIPERIKLGTASDVLKRCVTVRHDYITHANGLVVAHGALFDEERRMLDISKRVEAERLHAEHKDISLNIELIDLIIQTELTRAFPGLINGSYSIDSEWTVWTFPPVSMFGPGFALVLDMHQPPEDRPPGSTH